MSNVDKIFEEIGHARLSPSGSARWLNCTASVKKTSGMPNKSSKFAQEGTDAHTYHEQILLKTYVDGTMDKGTETAVRVSTDYINSILHPETDMHIEMRVPLTSYGISGLGGGSSDVILINYNDDFERTVRSVEVVDYKHGKGIVVEIDGCTQLMQYGLGTVIMFDIPDNVPIKMTITQPRAYHKDGPIRSMIMTAGELRKWADMVLLPKARECNSDDAKYVPSDTACRWCLANGDCDAQAAKYTKLFSDGIEEVPKRPVGRPQKRDDGTLDPYVRDSILLNLTSIKKFLKSVEDRAHREVLNGSKDYPMFKLVRKRSNRKFKDGADKVLVQKFPDLIDKMYASSALKSPSKLEELGIDSSEFKDLLVETSASSDDLVVASIKDSRKSR